MPIALLVLRLTAALLLARPANTVFARWARMLNTSPFGARRDSDGWRNKEANIKNPTLALTAVAVLLGGLLLLKSDATALPGLVGAPALTKKYSSIQKAGCFLAGRYCRVGFHWVCGLPPNPERRRCHCVPC